ncbi:hypothetical protein L0664_00175 [Octadecabacter sp. G9-8]|uniref:Uncharacterized protein n=1 Tax=Octadecabacter dasysiphoniae TaxID=2909341 RepID=A0ABS9CQF4_9RHOB|nr:hypothetical protein [Octadecabacter dasysiphoniae]MCF2869465.1 hypothetical protein [Octadecabacter dasysiphoniae]
MPTRTVHLVQARFANHGSVDTVGYDISSDLYGPPIKDKLEVATHSATQTAIRKKIFLLNINMIKAQNFERASSSVRHFSILIHKFGVVAVFDLQLTSRAILEMGGVKGHCLAPS